MLTYYQLYIDKMMWLELLFINCEKCKLSPQWVDNFNVLLNKVPSSNF